LKGFNKFYKFNCLKDEILRSLIPFIRHVHFPKGSIIFKEGDYSTKFYILIRGRISMRVKKGVKVSDVKNTNISVTNSNQVQSSSPELKKSSTGIFKKLLTKKDKQNTITSNLSPRSTATLDHKIVVDLNNLVSLEEETELLQFTEGDCFGEWAIIYNMPRSATAYVIEDSDLLYMEKPSFTEFLAKSVMKSDMERKNFIKSSIMTFNNIEKFESYYKFIVPMVSLAFKYKFVEKNTVIYQEGSKGNFFYVVYIGEFDLEKEFVKSKQIENEVPPYLKENNRIILKLERGAFAGLEIIYSEQKLYNFTLKSKSLDYNVLLRIDLQSMKDFRDSIKSDLKSYYENQNEILDDFLERHKTLKKNSSLSFRNLVPRGVNLEQYGIEQIEKLKLKVPLQSLNKNKNKLNFKTIKINKKFANMTNTTSIPIFSKSRNNSNLIDPNYVTGSITQRNPLTKFSNQINSISGFTEDATKIYTNAMIQTTDKIFSSPEKKPNLKLSLNKIYSKIENEEKGFLTPGFFLTSQNKKNNTEESKDLFMNKLKISLFKYAIKTDITKEKIDIKKSYSKVLNNKHISNCLSSWTFGGDEGSPDFYDTNNWNLPLVSKLTHSKKNKKENV
jgi:CRP-like cAMP-binding protein